MKRVNGYKDLDEYFRRFTKAKNISLATLEEKGLVKQSINGASALFWFKYHGVKVLYKIYENEYSCFSELISEELTRFLGFKSARYDLATFNNHIGVITYDFKDPKYEYITIYQILNNYVHKCELQEGEKFGDLKYYKYGNIAIDPIDIRNNLEDIWNAIEFYLYNETSFEPEVIPDLVAEVLKRITDYFGCQIISGNFDFHGSNIMLYYSENDGIFDVAPLYDNEDIFKLGDNLDYGTLNTPRLAVDREDFLENYDSLEVLRQYFKTSDVIFFERFKFMIDKLDYDTIFYLMKNVEEKIEIKIPENIKQNLARAFNENLDNINKIINEFEKKDSR